MAFFLLVMVAMATEERERIAPPITDFPVYFDYYSLNSTQITAPISTSLSTPLCFSL